MGGEDFASTLPLGQIVDGAGGQRSPCLLITKSPPLHCRNVAVSLASRALTVFQHIKLSSTCISARGDSLRIRYKCHSDPAWFPRPDKYNSGICCCDVSQIPSVETGYSHESREFVIS